MKKENDFLLLTLRFILHISIWLALGGLLVLTATVKAETLYTAEYKDEILSKIIPTYSFATIIEDCTVHSSASIVSAKEGELKKGALVEILQDSSEKWYKVENADEDITGWVLKKYIRIHNPEQRQVEDMTEEEAEAFANIMAFPSGSEYFVWTDIARQKTHIFKKKAGAYKLVKTFVCATGKNETPTTKGFFTISDRGKWFYSKRFDSGAMYWVRFNGTYLFHSVAMDKNKNIIDGVLGERRSSGCIRLKVEDARWFYENIPNETSVFVN